MSLKESIMKVSVAKKSMDEKPIKVYEIEKEIFQRCCEIGREMLKNILEAIDTQLINERDKKIYRHKGKRKTVIKTVMGEVEYERTLCEYRGEEEKAYGVYLLDKELGFDKVGFVSGMLAEKIVEASCEMPYRQASQIVSEMTGQRISHTGVWNVIQAMGQKVDRKEQDDATLAKSNKSKGQNETKILFEEQDGIWLNLQGKDRKIHGASKEMKLAIAYSGSKKTGKKRYNLVGKVACANFESVGSFYARKEGVIASEYNVDEIETRILNGDGANWIKRSITDENVYYQLDTFHRNQAIFRHVGNDEARKNIFELLYSKRTDDLLDVIEAYSNSANDEKERDNYLQLLTYFKNNKEGLVSYKRRGLDLPPEDGVEYRNCGAMESNVFSIIGRRMKRRRTNWSIDGGNNLARFLTLKSTGRLTGIVHNLISSVLPARFEEEVSTVFSAGNIPQTIGKGYDGLKQATIPYSQKWLKDLISFKPVY